MRRREVSGHLKNPFGKFSLNFLTIVYVHLAKNARIKAKFSLFHSVKFFKTLHIWWLNTVFKKMDAYFWTIITC
jgi:hypothetical protein